MARPRTISDDELLDATGRAIAAVGYARVRLADVAHEAGVSAPTLVNRFGGKRALLLAFAHRAVPASADAMAGAAADRDGPLAGLERAVVQLARELQTPAALASRLTVLLVGLDDPQLGELTAAQQRALLRAIRDVLDEAIDADELVPIDTRALADAVHAVYLGSVQSWVVDPRRSLPNRLRADLAIVIDPYRA